MFKLHSVTGRIAIGKSIGLIVGLLYIAFLPAVDLPAFSKFGFGTLLMFAFMGVLTGFMGLFDRHPVFDFKLPWWLRGAVIGFAFMLMYVLFTYDTFHVIMHSSFVSWSGLESPYWVLIDGTIIGILMSFFEMRFAGDGKHLRVK